MFSNKDYEWICPQILVRRHIEQGSYGTEMTLWQVWYIPSASLSWLIYISSSHAKTLGCALFLIIHVMRYWINIFLFFFYLSNQENFPLPARHTVWVCSCLHLRKHFSVLLSGHFDLNIIWCKILFGIPCHCDYWTMFLEGSAISIKHRRTVSTAEWPLLMECRVNRPQSAWCLPAVELEMLISLLLLAMPRWTQCGIPIVNEVILSGLWRETFKLL